MLSEQFSNHKPDIPEKRIQADVIRFRKRIKLSKNKKKKIFAYLLIECYC